MIICTDFIVSLNLQSREKDNCETNNYTVVYIMYILCNQKSAKFDTIGKNNEKLNKKKRISKCNK